jgi:branched-chain amino acid transport system permease protein
LTSSGPCDRGDRLNLTNRPGRLLALLAAIACAALLAGCGGVRDADQARICRTAVPVLEDPSAQIRILQQSDLSEGIGVRLDFSVTAADQPTQVHHAECRFAGGGQSGQRQQLTALSIDGQPLGEARLLFLQRFWLETSEAWLSDPAPIAGADRSLEVSYGLAYGVQQAINGLPLCAIYALLAAAYSLVYGLVGRINLAFGEMAAAGGYAALFGVILGGAGAIAPLLLAALLAVTTASLHGILIGRYVFAPLARATGQQALVATVGLSLFLQEYLRLTQGSGLRWVSPFLNAPFPVMRSGSFITTATPIAMMVAGCACLVACALLVTMQLTRFGRDWRAYADDPLMAAMLGVSPHAIFMKTFALASAMAGLAGYFITIFYGGLGFGASTTLGLKALIAAILGGIGSVPGAFLGGLAIGAFEAMWSATFPVQYRDLMIYAILAVVLIWRPGGFLGYSDLAPRRN